LPPRSKKQAAWFRAVASGDIKKKGLSKKTAQEYVEGHPISSLPERKRKKGK